MTKTKKSNFESLNCMIILLLRKIVWGKYLMIHWLPSGDGDWSDLMAH
jgi:hypothetical protein